MRNIIFNACKPDYLGIMIKKAVKRLEKDTSLEARK